MAIDLKDIASISGYSGLFTVVRSKRNGIIVESIDERKHRSFKSTYSKQASMLDNIGIYTTGEEVTIPLSKLFEKLYRSYPDALDVTAYDSPEKLHTFIQHTVPNYDKERVYPSHIKKLINWYQLLLKYKPELFKTEEQEVVEVVD